jgi:hypothetical protein
VANHLKIVAVLFLVFGIVGVLVALFSAVSFGLLAAAASTSHADGAPLGVAVLGITGLALTVVLLALSVPAILCSWGLFKERRWARILGIVLASISLIHFPAGTLIGAYVLWVLFQKRIEAQLT